MFDTIFNTSFMTNSVTLHRVLTASPEKVFRAFTSANAMSFWLPPFGFLAEVHEMDVRVGGKHKMSFTNFTTGNSRSFGGEYLEVIPNELLTYTNVFDDPNMPGIMTTTVTLKPVLCGTELIATQEWIPEMIPAEMCYLGWQESLEKLKKLVETDIPDA